MISRRMVVWLIALACVVVWPAGCENRGGRKDTGKLEPKVGSQCVVQFRRDALGGGVNSNPIGPTVDSVNGSQISLPGMIEKIGDDWLVLRTRDNQQLWIPRGMILCLEVTTE
jgi:hypothetical protein